MNSFVDDLGFMFISEQTSPDTNIVSNLTEKKTPNGLFYYEFDSILQSFDVINRNRRMYNADNVWSCIAESPKIQDHLRGDRWFGEADHPMQVYQDKPLSAERLQNVPPTLSSHKIRNPRMASLRPVFESANDTENNPKVRQIVTIPLLEVLNRVAKESTNVQMINESFGLDDEFIPVGFTKDNAKIVMESGSKVLYCNIEPSLRSKVQSYISDIL